MNIYLLKKEVDKEYQYAYEECFGTWIHGIFFGRTDNYEFKNFEEQKEFFYILLKKLLDDNKVIFFPPEKNLKIKLYKYILDGKEYEEELWDETPENIITYIKDIFPTNIKDENDDVLTDFWYGFCPEIGWIDQDTGEIVAS